MTLENLMNKLYCSANFKAKEQRPSKMHSSIDTSKAKASIVENDINFSLRVHCMTGDHKTQIDTGF